MAKLGRVGRPPGGGANKQRILEAAREEFATKGFRGATMRSIAAAAGVDIALLAHYYGNKDGLFTATLELPDLTDNTLAAALTGPPDALGERLTRWYLQLWENPATGEQMKVLARTGLSSQTGSDHIRDLLTGATTRDLMAIHDRDRFALAMSQLLGIAITRHVAAIPAVSHPDFETLITRVSPAIQTILDTTA